MRPQAPVAQLDRASDYESEGRTFESFRAHHEFPPPAAIMQPAAFSCQLMYADYSAAMLSGTMLSAAR